MLTSAVYDAKSPPEWHLQPKLLFPFQGYSLPLRPEQDLHPHPHGLLLPHDPDSLNHIRAVTPFHPRTFTLTFSRSLKNLKIHDPLTRSFDPITRQPHASPRAGGVTRGFPPCSTNTSNAIYRNLLNHTDTSCANPQPFSPSLSQRSQGRGAQRGASPLSASLNRTRLRAGPPQRTALLTRSGRRPPKLIPRLPIASAPKYYPGGPPARPLQAANPITLRLSSKRRAVVLSSWPLVPKLRAELGYLVLPFPPSQCRNSVSQLPLSRTVLSPGSPHLYSPRRSVFPARFSITATAHCVAFSPT
jgi:hypothetical protein